MSLTDSSGRNTIKSDKTLLRIIMELKGVESAGVTDLAGRLDLAKSTVHQHLTTLHEAGFVVREGNEYAIGLRFLDLGESARLRQPAQELVEEKVEMLAEKTDERAQYIVEEHGHGVFLYREYGNQAVGTDMHIGKQIPLHASSAGKAILSQLPERRREEIISEQELVAETDHTITDADRLREELETIRERGYACNLEESTYGLSAVGAPITLSDGTTLGALSVSGPTHRMKGERLEEEIPNLILGAANEVALNVTFS